MSCDTTSSLIRCMFDSSHFHLTVIWEVNALIRCLSSAWSGVSAHTRVPQQHFPISSIYLGCHLTHIPDSKVLCSLTWCLLLHLCTSMFYGLAGEQSGNSKRGKPLGKPKIKRNTNSRCLSALWHLCKFQNICEDHEEDATHHQKTRICDLD